jgi:hypothetical protein
MEVTKIDELDVQVLAALILLYLFGTCCLQKWSQQRYLASWLHVLTPMSQCPTVHSCSRLHDAMPHDYARQQAQLMLEHIPCPQESQSFIVDMVLSQVFRFLLWWELVYIARPTWKASDILISPLLDATTTVIMYFHSHSNRQNAVYTA